MIKHALIITFCLAFPQSFFSQKSLFSNNLTKSLSSCSGAQASEILNINNIEAQITTAGDMHWDLFGSGTQYYRFPKNSNFNVSGASALWIGGLDVGGQLKIAGQTYRQSGYDFWPGPLNSSTASTDGMQCAKFDYIWKLDYTQLTDFLSNYKAGNIAMNTYTPSNSILTWPTLDSTSNSYNIAPYNDINANGIYNPVSEGDYPKLRGDQELFYVFNDKGDIHTETGGQSIGLEIHLSAYGYGCQTTIAQYPELANTTFYHYRIINKSNFKISKTYIAIWVDANIGDRNDDYVGSNANAGYGYAYNADGYDNVYGNILPATATVLLKGPQADPNDGVDNDGDGMIDEVGEEITIPNFFYFYQNSFPYNPTPPVPPQMVNPSLASQFYGYMSGYWRDGTQFTCGGNAYGGTIPTKNVFPSNYSPIGACGSFWTENNAGNINYDRCYLLSVGPFTFTPNSEREFEIAFVTSVDSSSIGNPIGSINKLQTDVQKVKTFYNMPIKPSCIDTNKIAKIILPKKNEISIYPNPFEDDLTVNFGVFYNKDINIRIYTVLGQVIYDTSFSKTEEVKINLSSFSKAVYFIEVNYDDHKVIQKLVKE